MKIIARIRSDFPTKFGIPRQSGRVEELTACIVFEPEYRVREAVKGLEDFSHIWLLWEFSQSIRENWSPTVRPPRLGGNERMGVFATRSPFRPNPVGLSCVKLEKIDLESKEAPVLIVSGADLMDGTPIYDIKPYLPVADCHPEALGIFAGKIPSHIIRTEKVCHGWSIQSLCGADGIGIYRIQKGKNGDQCQQDDRCCTCHCKFICLKTKFDIFPDIFSHVPLPPNILLCGSSDQRQHTGYLPEDFRAPREAR